ncbi:MAG: ABC transporter permease subunit [candidate division Zixibacteria bacterium]|nr:sugar ABC transporter permease [candidate division Zixibacteria bacterium]NIU13411.1 sugar ABC transporter permease [candidate division Zixibacteria bacterium]NIV05421.1 ABC transporter permease subunit [candidate division Zixibacteria bacterium]NIW44225.1 ABC transporter permease subunit [Gammaproteobacteria bacterium]
MIGYHFGRGRSRLAPYLLLLPGILLYLLIAMGPSLATSVFSFTDATGIRGAPINWIGLDNYREFLFLGQASRDNYAALGRTLIFSFFVSTIQFGLGLLLALLVNQRLKGSNLFRTLYFLPVILGVVIQGLIWSLFLYPLGGPLAQVLEFFGTRSEFLGGSAPQAFGWIIVIQIWANMGITMVIFLAGLQTIPQEMYEAAEIDGASNWQIFTNVTWPLLTPSVNTNILLNIIGSLQAWQLFLVLIGYRNGTQVLGYLIYAQGFGRTSGSVTTAFRQGYAAAASIVLFFLVLILGITTQTILQRREERILG